MKASKDSRELHLEAAGRLILLLAVPIFVGVVMSLVARQERKRSQAVQHTLLVEVALERLMLQLRDADTSQRAIPASGDQRFLESFKSTQIEIQAQLADVSTLIADNPRQVANLERMRPLLERRLAFLQSEVTRQGKAQSKETGAELDEEQSKLLDSIQAIVDSMYAEDEQLLASREEALRRSTVAFNWLSIFGYGLIVIIVASLYRSVKRHTLETTEAEERLSRLNAELDERVRQRTEELHAREELLNIFVRYVPAGVAMLDRDMRYLQVSDRWCADYGIPREGLIGSSHYELFPDIPETWREVHRRCLAGESLRREEDRWDRADGTTKWLRWEIRPWGLQDGAANGLLVFGEDITERKQIQELLRESEETIRALLDTASQAILAIDHEGKIVMANRKASEMFHYDSNELIGQQHDVLIPNRLRERHCAHRARFFADPKPREMGIGMDLVGLRNDGTEFPIEVSLSSVATKGGMLAVSFVSDITERKRAEDDLRESEHRFRMLAGSLLTAQEEERRNLARELHDDVTQRLAFLAIELGRLAGSLPEGSQGHDQALALKSQTLRTSTEVRRLSHGLHPAVISDFGLGIALEEFCEEFQSAHDVAVQFDGLIEESRARDLGATCLYRVAQESMRNAVVHGHASKIHVLLSAENGFLQLKVSDNGIGFSPVRTEDGLGVISMMERMRLVGGTLKLESEPGSGTSVTAAIPLVGDAE